MTAPKYKNKTLAITNWNGRLTRFRDGDINSGMANYYQSWGYDCFEYNGTLTFSQGTTDITKSVITDMVVAGKIRNENGTAFMYAIGHLGRLYKIQINNTATKNPDYDTPVLLATLANGQTFQYGSFLDFFQPSGTEYIWIGHDTGVTRINFDGTSETVIGQADATHWISNVPRQETQFAGSMFVTNGPNLAQIDSTGTVSTYTKLSPGFFANSQARDVKTTSDGRYLVTIVNRNPIGSVTTTTVNTSDIVSTPGYLIYWNGTDTAASSSTSFPAFSLSGYYSFSSFEYVFGYNTAGFSFGTVSATSPQGSVVFLPEFENAPNPNAIGSSGGFISWASTFFNPALGALQACIDLYGTIDAETPVGLYRQLILSSSLSGGDIIRVPFYASTSLIVQSGNTSGYYNAVTNPVGAVGTGKSYFSTIEYNGSTTKYGFYMMKNVQDFLTSANTGVYETQHQFFDKKINPTEVRVYYEPTGAAAALVSFKIDLVKIDSTVLTGATYTFSSANQITATSEMGKFNPQAGPTSYLGVRVTNVGSLSPYIHRIEVDYTDYGT